MAVAKNRGHARNHTFHRLPIGQDFLFRSTAAGSQAKSAERERGGHDLEKVSAIDSVEL
jgi:hypothetical protein